MSPNSVWLKKLAGKLNIKNDSSSGIIVVIIIFLTLTTKFPKVWNIDEQSVQLQRRSHFWVGKSGLKGDCISPLESYRKPLEQEHGLPGVFCDRADASASLWDQPCASRFSTPEVSFGTLLLSVVVVVCVGTGCWRCRMYLARIQRWVTRHHSHHSLTRTRGRWTSFSRKSANTRYITLLLLVFSLTILFLNLSGFSRVTKGEPLGFFTDQIPFPKHRSSLLSLFFLHLFVLFFFVIVSHYIVDKFCINQYSKLLLYSSVNTHFLSHRYSYYTCLKKICHFILQVTCTGIFSTFITMTRLSAFFFSTSLI